MRKEKKEWIIADELILKGVSTLDKSSPHKHPTQQMFIVLSPCVGLTLPNSPHLQAWLFGDMLIPTQGRQAKAVTGGHFIIPLKHNTHHRFQSFEFPPHFFSIYFIEASQFRPFIEHSPLNWTEDYIGTLP